jgi:hypothetical protein
MQAGRPTKYRDEYCQEILDYFNEPRWVIRKTFKYYKGERFDYEKEEPCDIPTFNKFARKIDVNQDTIYEWAKVHPKFSESLKICKGIQADILSDHAAKGYYNPAIAKLLLSHNHGITETTIQINENTNLNLELEPNKIKELDSILESEV